MQREQSSPKRDQPAEAAAEPQGPSAEQRMGMARAEELDLGDEGTDLLEQMLERANLTGALRRVEQNRGAAGVDGIGVGEL